MAIRLVHVPRSAWSRLSASVKSASSALPSWTATARRRRCRSLQASTSCSARPSTTTSRKCRYSASRTRKVSGSEAWRTGGASNPVIATPCRCNSVSNLRAASGAGGVKAVAGAKDCMGPQGGARQSRPTKALERCGWNLLAHFALPREVLTRSPQGTPNTSNAASANSGTRALAWGQIKSKSNNSSLGREREP